MVRDTFYIDLEIQEFEHLKAYDYLKFQEIILNKKVLNYILENQELFSRLLDIMLDMGKYEVALDIKGRKELVTLSKMTLFQVLLKIIESKNLKLDKDIALKLSKALKTTSYDLIEPSNTIYEVMIDNRMERIPIKTFIDFLNLDKYDFKLILSLKMYKGYELNRFVYALMDFLKNSHLLDLYDFREDIITRIKDLNDMKYIDFEYFNKHQEVVDKNISKIKIDKELENILDKEAEKNTDLFKKVLNIYLKLCELFTYDEEYYFDATIKHQKISNVKKINIKNNKVVCFEMGAILSYYLNKLGINYHVYPDDLEYGKHHPTIEFRYQEYLIRLDIVSSALVSDLVNVKTNEPLRGITCINKNQETKSSFNNMLNRYYKHKFFDYEKIMLPNNRFIYEDNLSSNIKDLLRYVDLAYTRVNSKELEPMDKMGYFLTVLRYLKEKYKLDNMDMQVIRDYNSKYKISMLISLKDEDNYSYVLYDFNYLEVFSRSSMQKLFDNCIVSGIVAKEIPGISEKVKRK